MEQSKLGKRINEVRKSRGLTADKLSELCNINATYLRQIEGGTKVPSMPIFVSLCQQLRVSPNYLLKDTLSDNEYSDITELAQLLDTASPSQIRLATAMIKSALEVIGD